MIFAGELKSIHDLLYRPQQIPDEDILEAILATLCAAFREMADLLKSLDESDMRSEALRSNLRSVSLLASEICGECVPRDYAPNLKSWMDQIQKIAQEISPVTAAAR
jgi:hypothetical protein